MLNKDKTESLEDFYKRKYDWMPKNLRSELGHFNVFNLQPYAGKSVPYKKREFYKIMLVKGNSKVHFADQVIEIKKQALSFSNPQIPYKWEHLDNIRDGYFCIFNDNFFYQFGQLTRYSVFQPGHNHIFELTDAQAKKVAPIYERMFDEIASDYIHKYDVLRNLVFELIHFGMKMQPATSLSKEKMDAGKRISLLFMELLERQFPIDESHQNMQLRTASDFAGQLAVHVNHLNRAVKKTSGKTTTELIADRKLREAKILLKQSAWNVSEIAYALGFTEATHFNNFFKKHTKINPSQFRVN